MAIDSLRKRASVASLGLAFLGPSVVPDGTLGQADRQTVANSFYGILAGSAVVEIGGTSQIGAYSATGVITRERILGATSQVGAYSATGVITIERTIGGTSQLLPFASFGGIQVGGTSTAKGGYVPPTYIKRRIKKKDETILAQVHELVAKLEEAPIQAPEKIIQRVDKVAKRAKKVVYMEDIKAHRRELTNTANQIKRLQSIVDNHVKAAQEDEDAALKALFEVM